VVDWPDPELDAASAQAVHAPLDGVVGRLRRVLALAAEAGDPVPPATVELAEDPVLAAYQAASLAPVGPLDRQRLLTAPDAASRLTLLADLLDDAAAVLELRLGGGAQ
jgi:Lon protease-like protein